MNGAYMLCQHCGAHGMPAVGVDWVEAFRAFLRMHAECGDDPKPKRAS